MALYTSTYVCDQICKMGLIHAFNQHCNFNACFNAVYSALNVLRVRMGGTQGVGSHSLQWPVINKLLSNQEAFQSSTAICMVQ